MGITVEDLLKTKYLEHITRVVAGEKGLAKCVTWVHILEIRDIIKECVNGGEMILTTGIGFTSKEIAVSFMKELVEQNVSALCIETPLYYHAIDKDLINIANEWDFPLIEIQKISRFIDISRGLNTMILNQESDFYLDADRYDTQLEAIQEAELLTDGIKYTADYLGIEAAYIPIKGKNGNISPAMKKFTDGKKALLEKAFKEDELYVAGNVAIKQIKIFGKDWGYLIFNGIGRTLSQFELLILGRLSNRVRQDIASELLRKEAVMHENSLWIKRWLDGSLEAPEIKGKLRDLCIVGGESQLAVCCTNLPGRQETDEENQEREGNLPVDDSRLHMSVTARRVFEDSGFSVLGYMEPGVAVYIVFIPKAMENPLEKMRDAICQFKNCKDDMVDYAAVTFAIGKKVSNYTDLRKSYVTAKSSMATYQGKSQTLIIYDELYIERIMNALNDQYVLEEFVSDHLKGLIEPENEELLNTLKIYYDCNASKQKTAERLFIARQTLYFRLQKIEDIIGIGWMQGEKRVAMEFAIHAKDYLKKKNGAED